MEYVKNFLYIFRLSGLFYSNLFSPHKIPLFDFPFRLGT